MDHGITVIHHLLFHGGLLPAVSNRGIPHSNDYYGLLLEDDVELSPSSRLGKDDHLRYR